MNMPDLPPEDEDRVIRALLALDWLEFPNPPSRQLIGRVLGCGLGEATAILNSLRERKKIALKSRFNARLPGRPVRSAWKWQRVEPESSVH